jgi:release factor glutamine methyltransferase
VGASARPAGPSTLGSLADWATRALAACSDTPHLDAELLLARAAGVGRTTIRAFPERTVAPSGQAALETLVERRRDAVPIAYLLGEREFYSLRLEVGSNVLVPRPETELVVDTALAVLPRGRRARVLDLGTGCGAIALAIKHARPQAEVAAVDASAAALALARRNAASLGLEIETLESNWLDGLDDRCFDVIVANPPYVCSDDPVLRGALRHEPLLALDGGPDGLDAIRSIIAAAPAHVAPRGTVIVEHGESQGAAVRAIAESAGLRGARTLRDLAGHERVLVAKRL